MVVTVAVVGNVATVVLTPTVARSVVTPTVGVVVVGGLSVRVAAGSVRVTVPTVAVLVTTPPPWPQPESATAKTTATPEARSRRIDGRVAGRPESAIVPIGRSRRAFASTGRVWFHDRLMTTAAHDGSAPTTKPRPLWLRLVMYALLVVVIGAAANLLGWDIRGWFHSLWEHDHHDLGRPLIAAIA